MIWHRVVRWLGPVGVSDGAGRDCLGFTVCIDHPSGDNAGLVSAAGRKGSGCWEIAGGDGLGDGFKGGSIAPFVDRAHGVDSASSTGGVSSWDGFSVASDCGADFGLDVLRKGSDDGVSA